MLQLTTIKGSNCKLDKQILKNEKFMITKNFLQIKLKNNKDRKINNKS